MLPGDYRIALISLFFLLGCVWSSELNMTDVWIPELGWEVVCNWKYPTNDRLQSVRLYTDEKQFLIYRPETEGPAISRFYRTPDNLMKVDCESTDRERIGKCVMLIEPYQPPSYKKLTCETSGEAPWFRLLIKDYNLIPFVPPTDAKLEMSKQSKKNQEQVSLNCTSAGLPGPNIEWTVGYIKVPAEFTGRSWNATTKLWHVWSSLTTASNPQTPVTCIPEVHTRDNRLSRGKNATYAVLEQSSSGFRLDSSKMSLFLLPLFQTLVRR